MSKWFHKPPKKMVKASKKKKAEKQIQNLDRYRSTLKLRKLLSIILAGAAVIALVIILATAFFTGKFTEFFYNVKQISAEDVYPVTIKEQSFSDAAALNRYLAIMTKNGIIFLDDKGQKADEALLGFSTPVLRSNESGVMIYDRAGTQFTYAQAFQTGYTIKTDQKIITGALSSEGDCAIATYHDRYAAEVSVYNTDGSLSYRWFSASDKVICMAFDTTGKKLYVCCINAENGFIQTILYALSINSEKELYRTVLQSAVTPLYLQPFSGGKLAVVTTGEIDFLDNSGDVITTEYYYNDLESVCGTEKYLAVAQQNAYNSNIDLIVYNAEGEKIASTAATDEPLKMQVNGTDLYCLTEDEVLHWNFARMEEETFYPEENYSGMVVKEDVIYLYNNNTISRLSNETESSDTLENN